MIPASITLTRRQRWTAGAVALVVAVLAVVYLADPFGSAQTHVTAMFERTNGLYVGDDVRVLGVPVGRIDSITPAGTQVRVTFHYSAARKVPANAKAAIVAPSLVTGRYIQLAPVYTGGQTMADGATIPKSRTAVPVEWSQIETQLTQLTQALGPRGGGDPGTLNTLIKSGAAVFGGNGARLRDTLAAVSQAAGTVADGSGDLFTTVRNLDTFIGALDASSTQVTTFSNELASISQLLNTNRAQLGTLLHQADNALSVITTFVSHNKNRLTTSVTSLTGVAQTLAKDQVQLANVLHLTPSTLANFYNAYDANSGAFAGRLMVAETNGISNTICQSIFSLGGTLKDCQAALAPVLDEFNMESLPVGVNPTTSTGTPNQKNPGQPDPTTSTSAAPVQLPVSNGNGGLLGLLTGGLK